MSTFGKYILGALGIGIGLFMLTSPLGWLILGIVVFWLFVLSVEKTYSDFYSDQSARKIAEFKYLQKDKKRKKKKTPKSSIVVGKHYSPPDRAEFEIAGTKVYQENVVSISTPKVEDDVAAKEAEKKARSDAVDAMIKANRLKAIKQEELTKSQKSDFDPNSEQRNIRNVQSQSIGKNGADLSALNRPIEEKKFSKTNTFDVAIHSEDEYLKKGALALQKSEFNNAIYYYENAAKLGNNYAKLQLGKIYIDYLGYELKFGVDWIVKAAEDGLPEAESYLGNLFFNGIGVNKSYSEALKWYFKAIDHGVKDKSIQDNIDHIKASVNTQAKPDYEQKLTDKSTVGDVQVRNLGKLLSTELEGPELESSIIKVTSAKIIADVISNKFESPVKKVKPEPSYQSILKKRLKSRGFKFKGKYATSPDGKVIYIASVFQLLDLLEEND
jgi:hypothetical protein